jgi:hypothetical protein
VASPVVLLRVGKISVCASERISNFFSEFLSGLLCLEVLVLDILKVKIVDDKSGWHNVILIDVFNEGFNTSLLDEFLFVEASFSLNEVASNACD